MKFPLFEASSVIGEVAAAGKKMMRKTITVVAHSNPAGHVEVLIWLVRKNISLNSDLLCIAAEHHRLAILEWARGNTTLKPPQNLLYHAAKGGSEEILDCAWDWIIAEGHQGVSFAPPRTHLEGALEGVHLELAKHILSRLAPRERRALLKRTDATLGARCAARAGNLPMLEWCLENFFPPLSDNSIMRTALAAGQVEVVKFLQSKRFVIDSYPPDLLQPAREGNLEFFQYIHSQAVVFVTTASSPLILNAAVQYGHLSLVQFLHTCGIPIRADTLICAAMNNQLEVLKYLYSVKKEADLRICVQPAASNGHVKILQWINSELSSSSSSSSAQ